MKIIPGFGIPVKIEAGGHLVKVKVEWGGGHQNGGGKRGNVQEFSKQSRKRLLELAASLDPSPKQKSSGVYLTLTTLEILPAYLAKIYLFTFLKRMLRRFPTACGYWRLDYQERGAPHFHLIIFNVPFWDKRDVQDSWGEIVGEDRPFTRIELIRTWRGVMSYTAKYCARVGNSGFNNVTYLTEGEVGPGRFWGVFNRAKLPIAVKRLSYRHLGVWFKTLKRIAVQQWDGIEPDRLQGFTLFVEDPGIWIDYFKAC